jgi:hypothetical protein
MRGRAIGHNNSREQMKKQTSKLDLDVEGFAERLGAGLERFAAGDWSAFERPRGPDEESARQMLAMITELSAQSEFVILCESAVLGIAAASGLGTTRIQAALELGRRRGRRDAAAKVRGLAPLCRLMDEEPPSTA